MYNYFIMKNSNNFLKIIFIFVLAFLPLSAMVAVEVTPTASIQNLSPSASVNVGQTVYWNTITTGFTNPTFIAGDSIPSSSVLQESVNSYGSFSWTPKIQDIGGHTITIYVTDASGHSASASQNINVGQATVTVSTPTPSDTILPRQNVTFSVTPAGFTNPTYSVSDSVWGSGINNSNINSSGLFSWTPTGNNFGAHIITILVSDSSGNTASVSQKITVSGAVMTISSTSPGLILSPGETLSFSATTTGLTSPNYSISDSFSGTSLSNSNIKPSGIFSWTPAGNDIGTHSINIFAMDNVGNSANSNLTVLVNRSTTSGTISTVGATNTSANSDGATTKYVFSKSLSVGSSNKDVTELQKKLTSLGLYLGPITGYFGQMTKASVLKFQTKYKISPLGNVGPATRVMLNKI